MHSRRRPTVEIAVSRLRTLENVRLNDPLVKLYSKLERGEIAVGLTRLPISAIKSGYYERQSDETVLYSNLNRQNVPLIERMIRSGDRPLLDLYWSPLAPDGGGYMCADDETALAAYSRLNIKWVPCRILRPIKAEASEAAIWFEKHGEHVRLKQAIAPTTESYKSFAGLAVPPFGDLVNILVSNCQDTKLAIVRFHKDHASDVYYHHMLHALLRRHERLLDSINRLAELGRIEHAEALARVAYEGFLNFYIDWLSPEFFGPRLQLLSSIRAAQSRGDRSLDGSLTVLNNLPQFIENTGEKARISPLGSFFHSSIYQSLSLVAHQSYAHLDYEAADFADNDLPDGSGRLKQLGRWLDVLTAELVLRVRNDVGISAG